MTRILLAIACCAALLPAAQAQLQQRSGPVTGPAATAPTTGQCETGSGGTKTANGQSYPVHRVHIPNSSCTVRLSGAAYYEVAFPSRTATSVCSGAAADPLPVLQAALGGIVGKATSNTPLTTQEMQAVRLLLGNRTASGAIVDASRVLLPAGAGFDLAWSSAAGAQTEATVLHSGFIGSGESRSVGVWCLSAQRATEVWNQMRAVAEWYRDVLRSRGGSL